MYGKRRVVINKKNQIIIAGKNEGSTGGSWIPIGIAMKSEETGIVVCKFLKPENMFERKLTDENSIKLSLTSIKQTRDTVRKLYKIPK